MVILLIQESLRATYKSVTDKAYNEAKEDSIEMLRDLEIPVLSSNTNRTLVSRDTDTKSYGLDHLKKNCFVLFFNQGHQCSVNIFFCIILWQCGRATSSTNTSYSPPPTEFYYKNKQTQLQIERHYLNT